ncbi:hypothetical protein FGG08_000469 [Glutinoglossum americanum]|uniref:NB-ARC domain-containing protein n=1 Tax=Glutinoglossum americanum TaxID=1670608 RepID=A0A9P8II54_9PEZI|nr:hypothetical protein FGG08_000469 [Glutinoglossum americanum]
MFVSFANSVAYFVATCSIVVIHGLNGHAQRSFTHPKTGVYWPQDLLPKQVPTGRVLTYGYNAGVGNISDGQNVLDIANQLIVNLKDHRREKVKELAVAGLEATPHCGSDLANFGSVIAGIASAFVDTPKMLLKTLAKNSSALYDVSREFATVVHELQFKLVSFYELDAFKPPWWGGPSFVVVEKRSAVLGLPGEEVVAVHADHRDICRFESAEDMNYRPVWIRIEDFATEAARKLGEREGVRLARQPVHKSGFQEAVVVKEVEAGLSEVSMSKVEGPSSRNRHWKVPFPPCASFTGRAALLQKMVNYFMQSISEGQRRFAIHGLGGAGKTQLALMFAFRHRAEYSGVFFLDADSENSLRDDMSRLHDELELGCPGDKIGATKRWFDLDANSNVNWLLIFDNADDLGSYQLTDYFPLSMHAHIVITSRDPNARELTPDGLLLEMMEPSESRDLLISRAGLTNPTEKDLLEIDEIIEKLSYLPLAIDQAGAYIRTRRCTPAAYLRQFNTRQDRVLKFSPKLSQYNKSVITAWEVSFARIELDSPIAAKLLLLFCYLDSRRISSSLLECVTSPVAKVDDEGEVVEMLAEENGVSPELVDLVMDEDAFEEAIERVEGFSLVREFTEAMGERDVRVFSLHPLVAFCGRSRATQAQKREAAEQAICIVGHSFPEWSTDFSIFEFGRLIRSHLPRCLSYIDQPAEFGSSLGHLAKKLLLIIYSIRTIQLMGVMTARTQDDIQLFATAQRLLKKYADPYLDAVATFLRARDMGDAMEAERVIVDFLKSAGAEHGIDPLNPSHRGRFNATLGDLAITLAGLRRSLHRPSPPDALLSAWAPLNPASPSTTERNAKWYRDRTVGSYLVAANRSADAERLLVAHVAEFADCGMEGTDEHLAGTDQLASLYIAKGEWGRAEEVLRPALAKAKELNRDKAAWHVLYSEIFMQLILTNLEKYDEAEYRAYALAEFLRESRHMPDLTASALYTTLSLLARIAHEQCFYDLAASRWQECATLGHSLDWPGDPDLNIPLCALEAIEFESGRKGACGKGEFEEWRARLRRGGGREFLGVVAGEWKRRLEERMRCVCEGLM